MFQEFMEILQAMSSIMGAYEMLRISFKDEVHINQNNHFITIKNATKRGAVRSERKIT